MKYHGQCMVARNRADDIGIRFGNLTIQLISESLFVSLFVSQLMISTELFVSHLVGHVHEGVAQYGWQHFGKADTLKCVEMQLPLF